MKHVMYVMNDIHYLSKNAWVEGPAINGREKGTTDCMKAIPEVLNSYFDKILEDETSDAVLIVGDLVTNGDVQSHIDFRNELKRLKDAGKKVFVTWATHDYNGKKRDENFFNAVRYNYDDSEDAPSFYKTELPAFYSDYSVGVADSVHEESGSYSVLLAEGLRLVAIVDNGNGRSHCGLFEDGVEWLKNELDKARKNGEAVYCCVHHPVIPPWPIYQRVADFEVYGGYKEMREILCEYGVKIIFTGHTHVHGIRRYDSPNGGYFYDVASGAICCGGGQMRRAEFDTETGECRITSMGIETIKGWDTHGLSASDYIWQLNFLGLFEKAFPYANKQNWDKFLDTMRGGLNIKFFETHRIVAQFAMKKFNVMTLNIPAKLAGKYANLTRSEKDEAKEKYIKELVFTILRHIFRGNPPYTKNTVEYKIVMGLVNRFVAVAEAVGVDTYKLMKELTPEELVAPFLTPESRTGDDDNLTVKYDI